MGPCRPRPGPPAPLAVPEVLPGPADPGGLGSQRSCTVRTHGSCRGCRRAWCGALGGEHLEMLARRVGPGVTRGDRQSRSAPRPTPPVCQRPQPSTHSVSSVPPSLRCQLLFLLSPEPSAVHLGSFLLSLLPHSASRGLSSWDLFETHRWSPQCLSLDPPGPRVGSLCLQSCPHPAVAQSCPLLLLGALSSPASQLPSCRYRPHRGVSSAEYVPRTGRGYLCFLGPGPCDPADAMGAACSCPFPVLVHTGVCRGGGGAHSCR